MNSTADQMGQRLKLFATRVVKFARALPGDGPTQAIAKQLTKSGTSEAANYHAARRGKSRDDFISKLSTAAEEADETENWFKIIADANIVSSPIARQELCWLADESRQLRAILVAAVKTARANRAKLKSSNQILKPSNP
jgi:four helix bundle protein